MNQPNERHRMIRRALLTVVLIVTATFTATAPANAAQCTQRRPVVEVRPASQAITAGGVVTYDVKVRNMDGRGCEPTKFLVQAWAWSVGGQRLSVEYMVGAGNYEWPVLKPQQTVHLAMRARADADATAGTYRGGVGAHAESWEHGGVADVAAVIG